MVRKVFAVASVVFLLAIVAIAIDNYNSEWRTWQRAYFTTLKAHEHLSVNDAGEIVVLDQNGEIIEDATPSARPVGLLDRIAIELQLNINDYKVVINPDRSADTCMTCHVNVLNPAWAELDERFEHAPMKGLFDSHEDLFILNEVTFDQVGCSACHGGDPLALTTEKAHEFLRDDFGNIFLESIEELSDPKQMVRQHAIERIRWMTGEAFGYNFSDPIPERNAAIARAQAWWDLHSQTFAEEGYGEIDSPFKTVNLNEELIDAYPAVSVTGKTLEYIGSTTCIGCHTNPLPGGAPYIPESNAIHVSQWYQDLYKTSSNPAIYLLKHPTLAEVLVPQAGAELGWEDEKINDLLTLIRAAQDGSGQLPSPDQIADMVDYMKTFDVTCEACHGPGSLYSQMMIRGLATEYQGNSSEASNMIGHGATIARGNAVTMFGNSEFFALIQCLATQSLAPNCRTEPGEPVEPEPEPEPEEPEPEPEPEPEDSVSRGQQLAINNGCIACHTVDGSEGGLGPSWFGLFGKTEIIDDGSDEGLEVVVDEAYLIESIRNPGAQIVKGYPAGLMQPYSEDQLSEQEVADLIAYIQSLQP